MSPRFVLGRENVPCVAEVVNRSLKADCTDFTISFERPEASLKTNRGTIERGKIHSARAMKQN